MDGSQFRDFKEARAFVRRLGLKSESEWRIFAGQGKRPNNIPPSPRWCADIGASARWAQALSGWANESMDPLHVRTSRFLPRTIGLALVAAGLCMARGSPVLAACVGLAGTADGFDKETAVSRAQRALDEYIQQYKAENNLDAVTVSAMRAEPQPYWRGRVSENMMYHPDIVTAKSYTVCWQGVVSTYVCTSGAQVCW
jgi:hypothetical protein